MYSISLLTYDKHLENRKQSYSKFTSLFLFYSWWTVWVSCVIICSSHFSRSLMQSSFISKRKGDGWRSKSRLPSFRFESLSNSSYCKFCRISGSEIPLDSENLFPISMSIFSFDVCIRSELVSSITIFSSSCTIALKSFNEGGIFDRKTCKRFLVVPSWYGFSFLSYLYRKFSYVVCIKIKVP